MSLTIQEKEFRDFLIRHNQTINAVCWRMSGGEAYILDELRAQCVRELWDEFGRYGLSRLRDGGGESAWVYRVAYNAALHYVGTPHGVPLELYSDEESIGQLVACDSPDVDAVMEEIRRQLSNPECLLFEYYLMGYSYAEIASLEHVSLPAVRKRYSRLFKKIRRMIRDNY